MSIVIDNLKLLDRNPRRISAEAFGRLCESIKRDPEFMRLRPIVVDETMAILGGNMRWRACKQLGMKELPDGWVVVAKNLTAEQRRRFILIDNAPEGMAGEWDDDILGAAFDLTELESLGFPLDDIRPPNFTPVGANQQGRLDQKTPITCPSCGHEFTT